MRVSDLTGPLLDYWTARAEGVFADQLEIRASGTLCVRNTPGTIWDGTVITPLDYSTNWALAGPLVEKHGMTVRPPEAFVPWEAHAWRDSYWYEGAGDTPLIAICRAVVRAAFGDEVEDLPC